jgi:1-deoxy-D-xylulose-5-phosphate synthase
MQVKASVAATRCRLRAMKRVVHCYPLLAGLEAPADLRRLPTAQLPALASELRAFITRTVASQAGHFAAALGTVELAIAVHYVFDTPGDRIVWDGDQQAYPHKVLTGRRDRMHSIRQPGGLQPYPQRAESDFDAFGVGHSGTAISAALGLAIAAARRGEQRRVVAIIGERALTAGMAFEALNHAGSLPLNLLIVLDDSDASLSGNTGALANYSARMLSGRMYAQLREQGKRILRPMPTVWELARRSELHLKGMLLPSTLFEELGFNYIGPVDGRDVGALVATLGNLKDRPGRQFLHVVTRRATGNEAAPEVSAGRWPAGPEAAAATARPRPRTTEHGAGVTYAQVFGQWLCDMAETDPRIIAISPGTPQEAGLAEFARRFPDRFFEVGVAQQHAVTFAAGLATEGLRPVVAIGSTFLQRTYDQLIHDIALQSLPVVLAVDGAGLVGGEGATHQGSYDLSYLRCIPNMTVMTPADEHECRQLLYTAITLAGPAIVRYPRACGAGVPAGACMYAVPVARAQVRRQGSSGIALLVFGTLLDAARQVAERLDATLVNMRFVKPLDRELLGALAADHRALVTIEENALAAGAGSAVGEALASLGLPIPLLRLGIPDRFIEHGSRESCLAAARLDAAGLRDSIEPWWMLQRPEQLRSAAAGQ